MTKLKNKKRIFIITLVVFIITLLTTVSLYIGVNNGEINYEKVQCVVSEVTKKSNYGNKANKYDYVIKVSYNGKNYELINTYDSSVYKYYDGAVVEAYLSNGKLYANEAGVRTSSPLATAYFVFLYITMGMFIVCLTTGIYYKKARDMENNILKNV